ncbi:MAG: NAD-dependent epimerase/dehydratase family protein [Ilumatobacteraceae bacterium]
MVRVRCLVTGGSGYFGSLLVERLVADGHEVRNLDLLAADHPDGVEFVRGDVRDRAVVHEAVSGCDAVFHNVAQVPLANDEYLLRSVNVDGTRVLLEACSDLGVGKVVHTSSSAVFGVPDTNPVLPTTVPKPEEAYGHAKLAAEWACLDAARDGLDVSIVRPRTILGHGRLGIFGILFDWIADGADPVVLGDREPLPVRARRRPRRRDRPPARRRARRSSTSAPTASGRWPRRSSTSANTPGPVRG